MIRKCVEADGEKLMEYLYRDACINLFFIGDIHNFGFDSDFQHVFMDVEDEEIKAVYLIYRDNMCLQSYCGSYDKEFVRELIREYGVRDISGEQSLVEKYGFEEMGKCVYCHFACMKEPCGISGDGLVERLTIEDAEDIAELSDQVFGRKPSRDGIRDNIEGGSGRYYGIKKDGKLVALAGSTAECEGLAMVVGVGTDENNRSRGYATKVVGRLSDDLLKEGKLPCLFYENPAAARIYKKIGYRDIGNWMMIRVKEERL